MWFKKTKTFARFKSEEWCIQLAYVDEKADHDNGVKYLLFVKTYSIDPSMQKQRKERISNKRFVQF